MNFDHADDYSDDKYFHELRRKLSFSFLRFTEYFFKYRTGRKFELSDPIGRESHYISICRELMHVFLGKTSRLIINVPPRFGKSELLIHFIAWTLAQRPQSQYIYVSYGHTLAKKQTQTIRSIIQLPRYHHIFGVKLKEDSSAKDNFETIQGGAVFAAGAGGSITGRGAGIAACANWGGCIVIDDIHKPDEAHSDVMREGINDWYYNTLQSRLNTPTTPIIFIGQRVHEDDLAARLIKSGDFKTLILPALDVPGNALHPKMLDKKALLKLKDESPYVFASQYQQDPQPAGGGIFKKEWFLKLEYDPDIIGTFLTIDTAETDKNYNDATVFSFWGLYTIKYGETQTDMYALHWLDCMETRIEPNELEREFLDFYASCMRHPVKPQLVAIEKKSTGVTLSSVLKSYPGINLIDITRTKASGNKTARFLEAQPFVASKRVTLPEDGKHTKMCIEHCRKITANNSHRHDDIADTMYDAIKIALIEKTMIIRTANKGHQTAAGKMMNEAQFNRDRIKQRAFGKPKR